MKPQNRNEPSASWIACSSIDHIWDDPFNYHPAQTLGNPQTFYCVFCGISDGWVERLNRWIFLVRKPGEPWGTPCEISNMSFGDAGWQGGFRWLSVTPRTWYVPHDLMMGCSYGVWIDKGVVNVCECCECCDPYGHIWPILKCDQLWGFFQEEIVPQHPGKKLTQLLRMRSASFPMAAWKPSS